MIADLTLKWFESPSNISKKTIVKRGAKNNINCNRFKADWREVKVRVLSAYFFSNHR